MGLKNLTSCALPSGIVSILQSPPPLFQLDGKFFGQPFLLDLLVELLDLDVDEVLVIDHLGGLKVGEQLVAGARHLGLHITPLITHLKLENKQS